jgi:hypothetical protein
MKHLSKVYSGDSESLVTTDTHTYLSGAVDFCNNNAQVGDRCTISESYESLTGREEYTTIMTWIKTREDMYV